MSTAINDAHGHFFSASFFAMHRLSIQDERTGRLFDVAAARAGARG